MNSRLLMSRHNSKWVSVIVVFLLPGYRNTRTDSSDQQQSRPDSPNSLAQGQSLTTAGPPLTALHQHT